MPGILKLSEQALRILNEMCLRGLQKDIQDDPSILNNNFLDLLSQRIKDSGNTVRWNNITYNILEKEHSGKVATLKFGFKSLGVDKAICLDADVFFDPNAIPIIHAAMSRYPKLSLVTGFEYLIFDESNRLAKGRDSFVSPSTGLRRVHGPLMALSEELMKQVPDELIREDYYLEQYLEANHLPWVSIFEVGIYKFPPTTYQDLVKVKNQMKQGGRQVETILSLGSQREASPLTVTSKESKLRRLRNLTRDPINGIIFLAVKAASDTHSKFNLLSSQRNRLNGSWEPKTSTKSGKFPSTSQ